MKIKTCKYCNSEDLHWERNSYGNWKLFSASGNEHRCHPNGANSSTPSAFYDFCIAEGVARRWVTKWANILNDHGYDINSVHSLRSATWLRGLGDHYNRQVLRFSASLRQNEAEQNEIDAALAAVNGTNLNNEIKTEETPTMTTVTSNGSFDFSVLGEFGDALEALKNPTISLEDVEEAAAKAAREAVEELVPVEHHITISVGENEKVEIDGRAHFQLEELITVVSLIENNHRVAPYLVGPAGGGKTTAASQAAQALGLPFIEASMGPATSAWDLVGFKNMNGDYVPGILRDSYENGGVVLLDEMDNANASVLNVLNPILSNGHFTFPDGNRIARHPDFVLISAGNTYGKGADRLYVGRSQLDAAFLDRWVTMDWDYDEDLERDIAHLDWWVEWVQSIRKAAFRHQMRVVISPRASIDGAILLRGGLSPERVANMRVWGNMSGDDKARLIAEVGEPQAPLS